MKRVLNILALLAFCQLSLAQSKGSVFKFDFGRGKAKKGYIPVADGSVYTESKGYGIDFGSSVYANDEIGKTDLTDGYLSGKKPFFFSMKLAPGIYHLRLSVGDDFGPGDLAIRVENRRMMINRIQTAAGQHKIVELTVHLRDSLIAGGPEKVRLKPGERNSLVWDNKLSIEFNGTMPKINFLEIAPEKPVVTLFLAGNSTVVDQAHEPWAAWGQMVPSFFKQGKVAVANYAESGESLRSFIGEKRFAKILSEVKKGDYVFVEFGHNDQKQTGEGIGAFTSYKKSLIYFIDEVRKKEGIPVLVSPVQRRGFDPEGKIIETLGDYPEAVRQTAQEKNTALIDLNRLSKTMFEAMGPENSLKAFVHFPADTYPGQSKPLADNTHFRPYGAFEVAKLIVQAIRDNKIGLADFINEGVPAFNAAKPDLFEDFYWPESPAKDVVKPDGN